VTLTVNGLGGTDTQTATIRVVSQTYTTTTRVITYTYDPLYRLTDADYSSGEAFAYAYDAVGNRTVQTRTLTATTVITYAYDAANRLVNVDGVDYTWDANGNLLSDGVRTFTYDAANRLTSVTSGTLTTTFEYDGLGNRAAQTVDGVTTEYVLDIAGGLPEVIVATTGGASTRYVQVEGQILGQQESGAWAYVLPDHLGSVRQLVGSDSQVALAQSFDPFGGSFESAGSGASEFGYTGEWWGSYSQLLYLRARYYDPSVGRFLTMDRWAGDVVWPRTLNNFIYVLDNPINGVDPQGLSPLGTTVGGCHQQQPCSDPIPQVFGTAEDWSRISTGLDTLALLVDSYGDIVVISAGVFGVVVGVPAGGQVELTGLAGVAFAETLTAGTTLQIGNWVATGATVATIVADVKACKTRLEDSHLTLAKLRLKPSSGGLVAKGLPDTSI
jgi:RHS repeat-associated protein